MDITSALGRRQFREGPALAAFVVVVNLDEEKADMDKSILILFAEAGQA